MSARSAEQRVDFLTIPTLCDAGVGEAPRQQGSVEDRDPTTPDTRRENLKPRRLRRLYFLCVFLYHGAARQ